MSVGPQTQVDEVGTDIYRLSTFIPEITEHGFTVNQFLLTGDEPFLFHTGMRQLFPLVSEFDETGSTRAMADGYAAMAGAMA